MPIFALMAALIASAGLAAEPWPSFQNGGQLKAATTGLPLTWNSERGIAWNVELEGYGQSSPIVWGDSVYVTYCAGDNKERLFIRALSLTTGEFRWEHELANSTPEEKSNYISKAAPTPVADAAGVIAFFEGGNLVALDHEGHVRWERDLVAEYGAIKARHGLASSLEQDENAVFVWVERTDEPYVLAINKRDGQNLWQAEGAGKTSWSSPRLVPVGDERHLVLSAIGRIVGLDPADGTPLWQFEDIANNSVPTPIPLGEGRFLIGAGVGRGPQANNSLKSNGVIQISKNEQGQYSADFLWRAQKAMSSFGSPIVAGDKAFFVNRVGVVFCLDINTGEQHYAKRSGGGSVWATPVHVGDRVYLFGKNGTTVVIKDGSDFEVVAENVLWEVEKKEEPEQNPEAKPAEQERGEANEQGEQRQRQPGRGRRPGSPGAFSGPVLYAATPANDCWVLRTGDRVYCIKSEGT
ncbi:MAG: serine/threonine protein kinase [Planctomycetota bacterium]|nr:MAG: serine/threonine protein kinase [Planctomycetota bacterium]REJ93467.1 MAG: serine/threonine protein kinase [Planctomycetota bacterium]